MMMLAFFPLWAELDFILHLWLIKVPENAMTFCQIILLMVFVAVTDGGIWNVVNASGKVGTFRTVFSILTLLCVPVGFVIFKSGSPAYMLLVFFLIADIFWRFAQLYLMHAILHFPVRKYCLRTYLPVAIACLPLILFLLLTSHVQIASSLWHISHFILIFLLSVLSAYYLGLRKQERKIIIINLERHLKI